MGQAGSTTSGSDEEFADEGDGDDDAPAEEWAGAAAALLRPCPTNVPQDLKEGDRIVVWFAAPYHKWFVGKILRVDRRRTLLVVAEFDDGESGLSLDEEMYGVTGGNMWALLHANSPPLPATAAAAAAGPSGLVRSTMTHNPNGRHIVDIADD